jgi:UDP-N-acetylmuramate--alanine ligase
MFSSVRKIHFVGIGGIGMSAIAEILLSQGFDVRGSDMAQSENTDCLAALGAKIMIGHSAENIQDAEVVVYSSAVKINENPETVESIRRGIPTLRRAEMLAEVSRLKYTLAVAGTHGKTTTTSMLGLTLMKAGIDPTVIVGGRLKGFGGANARLGAGEWIIVEADEYDRSFLQLSPAVAIINNIEAEHLDIYKDFDDLRKTFTEFANKVPFYGFIAAGIDNDGVKDILSDIKKKIVTFGLSRNADVRAQNIKYEDKHCDFELIYKGKLLGEIRINAPGLHNVKNALGTIAVSLELGVEFEKIKTGIAEFGGVNRRFEIKSDKNNVLVIDDYAHHPTEIAATLQAARAGWDRRIVCVFQPHTYTRTQQFYKDFGKSFDEADLLIVTDVYPAREKPIEGVDGKLIADAAVQYGHKHVKYIQDKNALYPELKKIIQPGDIVITMGAGDIWKLSEQLSK